MQMGRGNNNDSLVHKSFEVNEDLVKATLNVEPYPQP